MASPWLIAPAPAFAADKADDQAAVRAGVMDAQAASYLDQLLDEINARRDRAGAPPVTYAGLDANLAVSQYLADLTPRMVAMHSCFHGNGNPVAPGWDYVSGSGFRGEARGEVLACPGDGGFWTAPKIADGWWNSPSHWRSLYGDPNVNAIACGTFGAQNGGRAYQTIACVTYRV
ncbi:MAG: CAP domain-containing protein [Chloroflexota bacterium]